MRADQGPDDIGLAKGWPPAGPPRVRGFRLRHMMLAVVAVAVGLWAVLGCLWVVLVFGLLLGFALVSAPIVVFVKLRGTRQEGLLRLLAAAAGGVPPGPAVEAYGDLCGLGFRRRLRALARDLDAGVPLPAALDRNRGVVPAEALVMIRVGWEAGNPAGALRDAAESAAGPWHPHRQGLAKALAYGLGMLVVLQILGGFLFYYIAPSFRKILDDFGEPLPPLTRFVFRGVQILGEHWEVALALALLELAAGGVLVAWLISYVFGFDLRLPLLDRLSRRRHAAAILRMLAMGVEGRRPLAEGLKLMAAHHPVGWARARLARTEIRAGRGEPWAAAMRDEGLIRATDAAVLDAAQRAGNLPWALRELAEGAERRSAYRLRALAQTLLPLIVVAVGALVGLIAVAYFLPLVALIRELAE